MQSPIKAAIITLSDRASQGLRDDESGRLIKDMLGSIGAEVVVYKILPDQKDMIIHELMDISDAGRADLVLTTGGTGLSPRDVTPESTLAVIDRELPGMAEAMRAEGLKKTAHAMISRAVAGIRKQTLIVNLPGSPKAVRENLSVILPALPHAIEKLKGDPHECGVKEAT